MKKALFIDCCISGEASRSKKLATEFFNNLQGYEIKHLDLTKEELKPLVGDFFAERQELLEKNNRTHSRFKYAHELVEQDLIVIAAPFWDLSFPALLKIYIENVSVDGITFESTDKGLVGLCKAKDLVYLSTMGGFCNNGDMEQATPYLKAICKFFGIDNFHSVIAEGMDIHGFDSKSSLEKAKEKASELAKSISC